VGVTSMLAMSRLYHTHWGYIAASLPRPRRVWAAAHRPGGERPLQISSKVV
jgi:hypothetical protein